jgi:hypothetical protein
MRRRSGDRRGAAISPGNLGAVRVSGRHGAAVQSKADALKTFRSDDRGEWLPRVLASLARAGAGRSDQAQKMLTEALPCGR